MENFGLLKFLKSPYPAARENSAAPRPEKSPENAENHSKNGEIYLDFIEKQRNFSRKIPKN